MKRYAPLAVALILFIGIAGCASSAKFQRIPADLDTASVAKKTITMKARRFSFEPEEIHVNKGTLVRLEITSEDTDHGFKLGEFGIDELLPEGETTIIEFYAPEQGEYSFSCSHFCGLGHLWMGGKIIVE